MAINTTNMIPNGLEFNKMRYRMEDKKALGGMNYKVYTGDDSEIDGENGSEIDEKNRVYYTKGEEIGIVLSNWFSYKESIELKYPEIVSDAISRIKIGTESLSTSISKGISIGYNNTADFQTSIAIGNRANSKSSNAVQIGNGTNDTPNSLQFMTKTIVSYDAATEKYLINADTAETAEKSMNLCDSDGVNYLSASKIGSLKYILPSDSDIYIGNSSKKIKEIYSENISCDYLEASRILLLEISNVDIGYIMTNSGIYSIIYEQNLQLKTVTFYYGGPKTISETTPSQYAPITCVIEGSIFGLQLRSDGYVYLVKNSNSDTVTIKSIYCLRTN